MQTGPKKRLTDAELAELGEHHKMGMTEALSLKTIEVAAPLIAQQVATLDGAEYSLASEDAVIIIGRRDCPLFRDFLTPELVDELPEIAVMHPVHRDDVAVRASKTEVRDGKGMTDLVETLSKPAPPFSFRILVLMGGIATWIDARLPEDGEEVATGEIRAELVAAVEQSQAAASTGTDA
jgi:hypothetical protein